MFCDEGHILQNMPVPLEQFLVDSPIYSGDSYGRHLILNVADRPSVDQLDTLFNSARDLAKILN